jgi:hypothetical protein
VRLGLSYTIRIPSLTRFWPLDLVRCRDRPKWEPDIHSCRDKRCSQGTSRLWSKNPVRQRWIERDMVLLPCQRKSADWNICSYQTRYACESGDTQRQLVAHVFSTQTVPSPIAQQQELGICQKRAAVHHPQGRPRNPVLLPQAHRGGLSQEEVLYWSPAAASRMAVLSAGEPGIRVGRVQPLLQPAAVSSYVTRVTTWC